MHRMFVAVVAAATLAGPGSASVITDTYSSFYVTGDSLSDDGNLFGPAWYVATGGSPFAGSFFGGGTFTNGDVWNEPLQAEFRQAGRDAENYAVAGAETDDSSLLVPGMSDQLSKIAFGKSAAKRGDNPLVSLWFGGNDIFDAVSGAGDVVQAALDAAENVAVGAYVLSELDVADDFIIFNLPDLALTPRYNLFEQGSRDDASMASSAFNAQLAGYVDLLETLGINVIDIDIESLFRDVVDDPGSFGLEDALLPCVFPSNAAAATFGQPRRCSRAVADDRLFIDWVHPNRIAHAEIGKVVRNALLDELQPAATLSAEGLVARADAWILSARSAALVAPAAIPLPAGLPLLATGLGLVALVRRRSRA